MLLSYKEGTICKDLAAILGSDRNGESANIPIIAKWERAVKPYMNVLIDLIQN